MKIKRKIGRVHIACMHMLNFFQIFKSQFTSYRDRDVFLRKVVLLGGSLDST